MKLVLQQLPFAYTMQMNDRSTNSPEVHVCWSASQTPLRLQSTNWPLVGIFALGSIAEPLQSQLTTDSALEKRLRLAEQTVKFPSRIRGATAARASTSSCSYCLGRFARSPGRDRAIRMTLPFLRPPPRWPDVMRSPPRSSLERKAGQLCGCRIRARRTRRGCVLLAP